MPSKITSLESGETAIETETFTAVEFDSFDEAKKVVDKAVHDRRLEIEKQHEHGK